MGINVTLCGRKTAATAMTGHKAGSNTACSENQDEVTFCGCKTAAAQKLFIRLVQAQCVGTENWDKVMLCGRRTAATAMTGHQAGAGHSM